MKKTPLPIKGRLPRKVIEHERMPLCSAILDTVCETYWVSRTEVFSRSKPARIAWARHVAMFLVKKMTPLNELDIALLFRRRCASTVNYALLRVHVEIANNKRRLEEIQSIQSKLQPYA